MKYLMLTVLYIAGSGLSYVATRAAIREEFPAYMWAEQGVEVPASRVRQCQSYCISHKADLYAVSPLACSCTGGGFMRF